MAAIPNTVPKSGSGPYRDETRFYSLCTFVPWVCRQRLATEAVPLLLQHLNLPLTVRIEGGI